MATKTTKVVSTGVIVQPVTSTTAAATTTSDFYQSYSVGDTCYYTYGSTALPCVVRQVVPHGTKSSDGTTVSYVIQGDISSGFPAGNPMGPFKNISLSLLTSR